MTMTDNEGEFLQEVLAALDKLPSKRLCRRTLYDFHEGTYCAIGAWLRFKGHDPAQEDYQNWWDDPAFRSPRRQRVVEFNDSLDMSARDRWHAVRQWLLDTLAEMNEEKANDN